jgi:putative ABC transport system ATP-binding protein
MVLSFLNLSGVGKQFEGRWILRGLELQVAPGQFIAIVGESGCGKSTLLNLIAGLDLADEGQVTLDGTQWSQCNDDQRSVRRREQIGFVFQAFHLLPHLKAWQNAALPLLLQGRNPQDAKAAVSSLFEKLGMGNQTEQFPTTLSGGEQQRVALARALIHQPKLLLADEPTGNLDPKTALPALQLLRQQTREKNTAVLMVTHSEQAAAIADQVLRLSGGILHAQKNTDAA